MTPCKIINDASVDWVNRAFPDSARNETARARIDAPLRFLLAAKPIP